MRYYEGHGKRPTTKVGENFHQRSTLQVSANPKKWGLNQAKTGEGSGFVGLCAVDVQRTWQLKCRVAVAVLIFPSIGSCAQRRPKVNCPVFLALEISQRSRDAIARKIGGTGSVGHAQQAQWAGNQRLVPNGSKPQYTVEPLLNQIDLPIRTRHLQLQLGVSSHEGRQGRHDRCARYLGRKIDP